MSTITFAAPSRSSSCFCLISFSSVKDLIYYMHCMSCLSTSSSCFARSPTSSKQWYTRFFISVNSSSLDFNIFLSFASKWQGGVPAQI
jgi:hypothetical protein